MIHLSSGSGFRIWFVSGTLIPVLQPSVCIIASVRHTLNGYYYKWCAWTLKKPHSFQFMSMFSRGEAYVFVHYFVYLVFLWLIARWRIVHETHWVSLPHQFSASYVIMVAYSLSWDSLGLVDLLLLLILHLHFFFLLLQLLLSLLCLPFLTQ